MFDWLKRKAVELQENHVQETLAKLIQISNEAHSTIARLGHASLEQRDTIHRLQEQLRFDLIGPVPIDEIKQRILEPALRAPAVTEGARMAVNHVYDSFVRAQQGG